MTAPETNTRKRHSRYSSCLSVCPYRKNRLPHIFWRKNSARRTKYSVASHASCQAAVLVLPIFISLIKDKYWRYWLRLCNSRLPMLVVSVTLQLPASRVISAYAKLSPVRMRNLACFDFWLNAWLCFIDADWLPTLAAVNHYAPPASIHV